MRNTTKDRMGFKYAIFTLLLLGTVLLCVCLGSVNVPPGDTLKAIWGALTGTAEASGVNQTIILSVRLPRVLSAALCGAALSVSGCAMQGLLKNPLADGTTLGVSSGASLGAVAAIAFGIAVPALPLAGTTIMAVLSAFVSLLLILGTAYRLDRSLSTNTIILLGVIFSMFANSIVSLIVTFASEKAKDITFWTMGSLSGTSYVDVLMLFIVLLVCSLVLMCLSPALNAFAVGEENARDIGVNVRLVKLAVLICASALIGVCVAVGGTIGFVGLVIPHMTRMIAGPNHKKLLPSTLLFGSTFLMLADLAARTVLAPRELPIGVVTSLTGSAAFIIIFFKMRRGR